jgi:RHS repeat-associated protein
LFEGQREAAHWRYADTLTGLDYYVSRYYDPVVGIFLSADDKEGNAQGMNPYAYVTGNPESKNDPTGRRIADANGDFAYIDPEGDVSIYIKNPGVTSGPGYVYTQYHYTKAEWHTPAPKTPPINPPISIDKSWSYGTYPLFQRSWGLWGIPLWQGQLIFTDLNTDVTGGLGPSDDSQGLNFGLFGDANAFDLTYSQVVGNKLFGITTSVGIRGPETTGQLGWANHTLGAGVSFNPIGSLNASSGVNFAGVNVSGTVSLGVSFQVGASLGEHGLSVSIPFLTFGISFSPASIGGW